MRWPSPSREPVSALLWFFVAVIMVILGTYLLFIAGSVALCRLLQKNKRYYYKTNHFVSVSSMLYRMKRNGAGLASICILCTMVLVMVSSTVCLYIGAEDSLVARYPRSLVFRARMGGLGAQEAEAAQTVRDFALAQAEQSGQTASNLLDYRLAEGLGLLPRERGEPRRHRAPTTAPARSGSCESCPWRTTTASWARTSPSLPTRPCSTPRRSRTTTRDVVALQSGVTLTIADRVDSFLPTGDDVANVSPVMYLFVPNFEEVVSPLLPLTNREGSFLMDMNWYFGFDLDGSDQAQIALFSDISAGLESLDLSTGEDSYFTVRCECRADQREGFFSLYGGLFFLGILLGIVFLFAAVLMIYYKQISEGYEDQARFDIMQRVGMTRREIRRSINSQILTVFFLPLLTAGVHLAFAFPLIYKMLILFGVMDLHLLILTTASCYLVFAVLYTAVYRITSGAYYGIVSGAR